MPSITPKITFQKDKEAVKRHQDLVVSDHVQSSVQTAIAQVAMDLRTSDQEQAAAKYYILEGVRIGFHTWLNLAEAPQEKPIITDSKLNY